MDKLMIECNCTYSNCWYNCNFCGKELHEPDITIYCKYSNMVYCTEDCLSDRGEQGYEKYKSQQENEG